MFKFAAVVLLVSLVLIYHRDDELFTPYSLPAGPKPEGPLAPNKELEKAEYILENQIVGPESLLVEGDSIYATLYNSRFVEIVNGEIIKTVQFRKDKACDEGQYSTEPACGRPLGIRRLSPTELVVVDSYLGVFVIDWNKGTHKCVLSASLPVEGRMMQFLNDVEVLNEDEIIFTDSSSKHSRRNFMSIILEHSKDGRIIKHKISNGETKVLLDGLYFPNGIQMLSDRKSFVFAELTKARIMKYDLSTGRVTTFAENLPGLPDNIRSSSEGTLWVGLTGCRFHGESSIVDKMGPMPKLRANLYNIIPGFMWSHLSGFFSKSCALIIELNEKGQIVRSLQDLNGKRIKDSSQISVSNGFAYIGSYHAPYIGKIKIN